MDTVGTIASQGVLLPEEVMVPSASHEIGNFNFKLQVACQQTFQRIEAQ